MNQRENLVTPVAKAFRGEALKGAVLGLPILRFRPSTALLGPYRGYWSQSHPLTKKDAEPDDHLWPVTQLSGIPVLVSL